MGKSGRKAAVECRKGEGGLVQRGDSQDAWEAGERSPRGASSPFNPLSPLTVLSSTAAHLETSFKSERKNAVEVNSKTKKDA